LQRDLAKPRNSRSLGEHLRRQAGLDGVKIALLHEVLDKSRMGDAALLAQTIKRLPLQLLRPRPLAEAISSAGGVCFDALDENLMLKHKPGVFYAGEMLDWEAPTGGYLLTACFASGVVAGRGVVSWFGA
jgi:predicted flavoprotein YhiN